MLYDAVLRTNTESTFKFGSHLHHPSFAECTRQVIRQEHSMLLSVTTLMICQVQVLLEYLTISNLMLAAIEHVVDDNFVIHNAFVSFGMFVS